MYCGINFCLSKEIVRKFKSGFHITIITVIWVYVNIVISILILALIIVGWREVRYTCLFYCFVVEVDVDPGICPVPGAILKGVEVACGLVLLKDVNIEIRKKD